MISSIIRTRGFPRVRGDVPDWDTAWHAGNSFSPRARGCSCSPSLRAAYRWVFPACAGMFLMAARSPRLSPTFSPRARGCSCFAGRHGFHHRCFPRVRGDVPGLTLSTLHSSLVFPAYAGMFRGLMNRQWRKTGFPRVRGDVPSIPIFFSRASAFSPRTRGCSALPLPIHRWRAVFPACAGMFLPIKLTRFLSASFPHKHEDLPPLRTWNFSTGEYSPRKREHSGNPP